MGRLTPGVNDLLTVKPDLASEWHPSLNGGLLASGVTSRSNRDVWWLGTCGHEWSAKVGNRWAGSGCPFCSVGGRKRLLSGFNDLATLHPHLVSEWHPDNTLLPGEITAGSKVRVRWLCSRGHDWFASVNNRTANSSGCPVCTGSVLSADSKTLEKSRPDLASEWSSQNSLSPGEVTLGSGYRATWVCRSGHTWAVRVADRVGYNTGCPECPFTWDNSRSGMERELEEFLNDLGVVFRTSDRKSIAPKELDFLFPEESVALEFNGLYWHSDSRKPRNYHLEKSTAAARSGLQLIHVWEDDWVNRRRIVERMISRKLGVSREVKINARSLSKSRISASQAREFLDLNHLQGYAAGREYLALTDHSGVRALMVLKRREGTSWELVRFATDALVRGGHSRLFKWFLELHPEVNEVTTFADRGVSDGGLYKSSGFAEGSDLPPDYMYIVNGVRVHKFNYRKSRFKSDPGLQFKEGLTERELAELNGLSRIYDAGKTRWVWTRSQ